MTSARHHATPRLFKRALVCIVWVLVPLAAVAASQESKTVYQGTVGSHRVVMELPDATHAAHSIFGRYFYVRHLADIPLLGKSDGSGYMSLTEQVLDSSVGFELTRQSDGGLKGTWFGRKRQHLPVALHPARMPRPSADTPAFVKATRKMNFYAYLRLRKLHLEHGKKEQFMGYGLRWLREPRSGISTVQLLDGYPPQQIRRINRTLRYRLWHGIENYYECVGGGRDGGEYRQSVKPKRLGATVVSVNVFVQYWCGGPHPDYGHYPININAKTGRLLTLEDILWLGNSPGIRYSTLVEDELPHDFVPENTATFDRFSTYRGQTFAPWLVRQWQSLYPKKLAGPEPPDCDYARAEVWEFAKWYLTPKGIRFLPGFPHVVAPCRFTPWSVLPWSRVASHAGRVKVGPPSRGIH